MENGNKYCGSLRPNRKKLTLWGEIVTKSFNWDVILVGTEKYPWISCSPAFHFEELKYKVKLAKSFFRRPANDTACTNIILARKGPLQYHPSRSIRWKIELKRCDKGKPQWIRKGTDVTKEPWTAYMRVIVAEIAEGSELLPLTGHYTITVQLSARRSTTVKLTDVQAYDMGQGTDDLSQNIEAFNPLGESCDVEIKVKDETFEAHRAALESRSPVLAAMFSHDMAENNTGVISIDDIEPEEFQVLLSFVYSGQAENLTSQNVFGTYYAADKYGLQGLKRICARFLESELSINSVVSVIRLALRHCDEELLISATNFFTNNGTEIMSSRPWRRFAKENPNQAKEIYSRILGKFEERKSMVELKLKRKKLKV